MTQTLADSASSPHDGTTVGATDPAIVSSPWAGFTNALSLNGVDQGVDCPGVSAVHGVGAAAKFTLEAKVKVLALPGNIYGQIAGSFPSGPTAQPTLFVFTDGTWCYTFVSLYDSSGDYQSLQGATQFATGATHDIASDYDGTTLRLYLDGAVDASMALSGVVAPAGGQDFYIGCDAADAYPLEAVLDEVRWSSTDRYAGAYVPATSPFTADAGALALFHLDGWLVDLAGESFVDLEPGGDIDFFDGTASLDLELSVADLDVEIPFLQSWLADESQMLVVDIEPSGELTMAPALAGPYGIYGS